MTVSSRYDMVVLGTGIAGLCTALSAQGMCVALVTPHHAGDDGSSALAQGGIAAALGPGDSPQSHVDDTLAAGVYRNEVRAVAALAHAAPDAVDWLAALGVPFDRDASGAYALSREAAHAHARVVHAGGDASGAAIMRALSAAVNAAGHVDMIAGAQAVALIGDARRVGGVWLQHDDGARRAVLARHVVLATGGIGALYARTTNPAMASGDGIALAMRVGARLRDLEFVQFHPTALAVAGSHARLPLLSEALRGAGATLVDAAGRRFMTSHPLRELAPRDVVARAVFAQAASGGAFLDLRPVDEVAVRFPSAIEACLKHGIDPLRDPVPISPAAHYHMGGVAVDEHGATSVPGLYAVGEVAGSGVHGANRLASNSLLEGVVRGRALGKLLTRFRYGLRVTEAGAVPSIAHDDAPLTAYAALRELMWREVALLRDAPGLCRAIAQLQTFARDHAGTRFAMRAQVAAAVARAALTRAQSVGAHWRRDSAPFAEAAPCVAMP